MRDHPLNVGIMAPSVAPQEGGGVAYVPSGKTGYNPPPVPGSMLEGMTPKEAAQATTAWDCSQVSGHLYAHNYPAVSNAMLGLEHNNADYLEEYKDLPPNWRSAVNFCAQEMGQRKADQGWAALSPTQKEEHLESVQAQLDAATAGRPGVSLVCPPGTSPEACKKRLEAEIDRVSCSGIALPMGGCVPGWILWAGGAAMALLVYNAVRR